MTLKYMATIPNDIPGYETIVLPVSMSQPLERGNRLEAILKSIRDNHYDDRFTILVCDYLNRHNCFSDEKAIEQGDEFLNDHKDILKGLHIVRWRDFLATRKQGVFEEKLAKIVEKSQSQSQFYNKMKKTWEKCMSATKSLEASIKYQMEEYAAILCMTEFDHIFYPKRTTYGLAYLYSTFTDFKPQYNHIRISQVKGGPLENMVVNVNNEFKKKDRRLTHVAFRALLDHMDFLLASGELPEKSKRVFAEEVENVLMSHGLMGTV